MLGLGPIQDHGNKICDALAKGAEIQEIAHTQEKTAHSHGKGARTRGEKSSHTSEKGACTRRKMRRTQGSNLYSQVRTAVILMRNEFSRNLLFMDDLCIGVSIDATFFYWGFYSAFLMKYN